MTLPEQMNLHRHLHHLHHLHLHDKIANLTPSPNLYARSTDQPAGPVANARALYAGTHNPISAREQGEDEALAAFSFAMSTASAAPAFPSSSARVMPPKRSSIASDLAAVGTTTSNSTATTAAAAAPNNKRVKVERSDEFSEAVKKRLHGATRTGQACDRCKIRKIRCDGLAGGCSPCLQNHTECCTTDRITGRATSRGYVEDLESQLSSMRLRVQELEQQLGRNNGDVKATNGYSSGLSGHDYLNPVQHTQWGNSNTSSYNQQASSVESNGQQVANDHRPMPSPGSGRVGASYIGVTMGNSRLSPINGTTMSILGMQIDIADFESNDMDEPDDSMFHPRLYNKSYQSLLQTVLNINPRIEKVELPQKDEGMKFVALYFQVMHPFLPILHEPTLRKLVNQYYDDPNFHPTAAQTVVVHLVFAIMFFQYAARNWENVETQASFTNKSNLHYHYALSMFYQLVSSHTFEDVQALTLLCAHLRAFPKPGASWMMTRYTISLAIELGMHRSVTTWTSDTVPNLLQIELRKRAFWALLLFDTSLAGKLGRPLAFRLEDFDVEPPEEWDDDLLSENGLDTSRPGHCRFKVGLHAWRLIPLWTELYNTLYAVRRQPENYIATVNKLESRLQVWREAEPEEFTNVEQYGDNHDGQLFHHYIQSWGLEVQLLLRHPSASMTTDAAFNAESLRICIASSRKLLGAVRQMQKLRSLDTTWYTCAVYVNAITTTLFAQWEKRDETSSSDLTHVKEEMELWLDIMGDYGRILGAGDRLRQAVKVVTESTLTLLNRCSASRNASTTNGETMETNTRRNSISHATSYGSKRQSFTYASNETANGNASISTTYLPPEVATAHQATPYPTATQYSGFSSNASPAVMPSFHQATTNNNYATFTPTTHPALTGYVADSTHTHNHTNTHNHNHNQANNTWRPSNDQFPLPHLWFEYAGALAGSADLQSEYTANALIQLGGGREGSMGDSNNISHPGNGLGQDANTLSQVALDQLTALQSVTLPPNMESIGGAEGVGGAGVGSGQMGMGRENIWPRIVFPSSGLGGPMN